MKKSNEEFIENFLKQVKQLGEILQSEGDIFSAKLLEEIDNLREEFDLARRSQSAKEGNTIPHEQVMNDLRKKNELPRTYVHKASVVQAVQNTSEEAVSSILGEQMKNIHWFRKDNGTVIILQKGSESLVFPENFWIIKDGTSISSEYPQYFSKEYLPFIVDLPVIVKE